MQMATTYLQLGRAGEAREILQKYHDLDPTDPTVEYYLSIVCAERHD
jgi:predicted Zn-dependent protease